MGRIFVSIRMYIFGCQFFLHHHSICIYEGEKLALLISSVNCVFFICIFNARSQFVLFCFLNILLEHVEKVHCQSGYNKHTFLPYS